MKIAGVIAALLLLCAPLQAADSPEFALARAILRACQQGYLPRTEMLRPVVDPRFLAAKRTADPESADGIIMAYVDPICLGQIPHDHSALSDPNTPGWIQTNTQWLSQ
jgi:hypothetical protein